MYIFSFDRRFATCGIQVSSTCFPCENVRHANGPTLECGNCVSTSPPRASDPHSSLRSTVLRSFQLCRWSSLGLEEGASWVALGSKDKVAAAPLHHSPPLLSQHLQLHFSSWPRVLSAGSRNQNPASGFQVC